MSTPDLQTSRVGQRPMAQSSGHDVGAMMALVGAFALIAVAIGLGGSWVAFVDVPAMLIVLGGTFAVTAIS